MINVIGCEEFITEKIGDTTYKFRKMQWQDIIAAGVFLRNQQQPSDPAACMNFLCNDPFGMGFLLEQTSKAYGGFDQSILQHTHEFTKIRELVDRISDLPKGQEENQTKK